jgi:acyl-CoA dehydrogenase
VTDLSWPFFEERHRELAAKLEEWCEAVIHDAEPGDPDYACRATVAELGKAGFLKLAVSDGKHRPDVQRVTEARGR